MPAAAPLTRAAALGQRAEIARRVGNSSLASSYAAQALSATLVPRAPHAKPTVAAKCSNWVGRNFIRFKFVEGTAIRLDQNNHFFSDNGPNMTPQFAADLAVINAITDLLPTRLFDASDVDLLNSKDDAEKNTGEEQADLTLWYDGLVGPALLEDITQDPVVCARAAELVNTLNALSIIEVAHPGPGYVEPPTLPFLAPATATAPTSLVLEPQQMGAPPGLNSPLITASRLDPAFRAAWEGAAMGITDIELSFYPHEKFNVTVIPGGSIWQYASTDPFHGVAVMASTFGTAFSANDPTQARYGTRGFAPQARRAFSPQIDVEWFSHVSDIPEAIERAGSLEDPSDVILMETQDNPYAGSVVGPGPTFTASEYLPAVYDTIRTFAGRGRIIVEAAGNGANYIDPWTSTRANSGALITGSNTGDGVTRSPTSGFGDRVDVNAWGANVDTAAPMGYNNSISLTPGQPQNRHYIRGFGGTSSASALVAGAVGQIVGTYRTTFGLGFARPSYAVAQTLRSTLRMTGGSAYGQQIGVQPNVEGAVADFVLANRLTGCTDRVVTPHDNYVGVGVFGGTTLGVAAPWPAWPPMNCATRSDGSTNNSGIFLLESVSGNSNIGPLDLGHNPDRSFLIEAWINIAQESTNWQTIIAKENPRNYGLWVAPTGWSNANLLHFSYWPEGSSYYCPSYSVRRVAGPGAWGSHHVAVRFDRRPGTNIPTITFFIDGTADPSVQGCGAVPPNAWGTNQVDIAKMLTANSLVGDVRLYHRYVPNSEVAFHAAGGVW